MKKSLLLLLGLFTIVANGQIVNIPDTNFKNYLIEIMLIDTNNDGEIQVSEAETVTSLNIYSGSEINSIEGIQSFINLTSLDTEGVPLNDVDISGMIYLDYVDVTGATGHLNASGCTSLEVLENGNTITGLDVSGCPALTEIVVYYLDELDFEGCTGLEYIGASGVTFLTHLDVSSLPNLETVNWINGALTSIDIDGSDALKYINLMHNNLTDIDFQGNVNLLELNLEFNNITDINVSGCSNLTDLNFYENPLESLDVSNCTSLPNLAVITEGITYLNVTGCSSMYSLSCNNSPIESIDLTGMENLHSLTLNNCGLTSLDVSGFSELETLRVNDNNLSEIILTECTALVALQCYNNALTEIDLTDSEYLSSVWVYNNNFTSLDFSNNPLINIQIQDNPLLETIFMKNGYPYSFEFLAYNCPQIQYVCADPEDVDLLQEFYFAETSVVINSYCSFIPGGEYNSITGSIGLDLSGDGCDDMDTTVENQLINAIFNESGGVLAESIIFSNTSGSFTSHTPQNIESVTITPAINAALFEVSPPSFTQEFIGTGNNIIADFCITANGTHPDLDAVLLPIFDARPGFDATYKLIVNNKGNQVQSGSITLSYNDVVIDFIESSIAPASNTDGSLLFNFTDLFPFNNIAINLTFNINSPLDDPAVNIDDILPFTATIITTETDDTPEDNTYQFDQVVIGSYDPNDKQIVEGTSITPEQIGNYLHYLIRFQNKGTAEAINIVVKDMLAENLDWDTFIPVSASHSYRTTLTEGNKVEFFFENIWLPAEEDNEPESHGFLAFKIKPKAEAQLGDVFENTAEIYFDYNAPIITNTVSTAVEEIMSPGDFNFNNYFMVYPNPTKDIAIIKAKGSLGINTVNIYNMLGQLVSSVENTALSIDTNLDISSLQDGQYLLEITTDKGKSTCRLIKQ